MAKALFANLPEIPGQSPLAIPAPKPWNGANRTRKIWGLVVHTTGSALPSKALSSGVYPTVAAVNYYQKSHGTHYVMGWRGIDGDLILIASELERAHGVGFKDQKASIDKRRWKRDLPKKLVELWRERWPDHKNPNDLFPGSWVNNVYVHVEMPPCVFHHKRKLHVGAKPMRDGLRFTKAQHQGVALLALDLARRYGWNDIGERTGRLVGHEDLSPITRHDKRGGWDPGFLRQSPYFDFDFVVKQIQKGIQ